jgi:hypothetical protein
MVIIAVVVCFLRGTDLMLMQKIPDECPSFINGFIAGIISGFA